MQLGATQSAMRPSLYRHGVIFPDLESCSPRNKGLRDKIRPDLNFPGTNRDRRSDRGPLAVKQSAPGCVRSAKIDHQHMPLFLVSYNDPKTYKRPNT
jgi:hypothetical protein